MLFVSQDTQKEVNRKTRIKSSYYQEKKKRYERQEETPGKKQRDEEKSFLIKKGNLYFKISLIVYAS